MKSLKEINAVEFKAELTANGISVIDCRKGKGTTKKATYLTVASADYDKALAFLTAKKVVSATGRVHTRTKSSTDSHYIGDCYYLA
jgi:hypothetical protein